MAVEFNLGRVRPHYRGVFNATDEYDYYDWVTDGGSSYICVNDDGATIGSSLNDETVWTVMARGYGRADGIDIDKIRGTQTIDADKHFVNVTLIGDITLSFKDDSVGDFCLLLTNGKGYNVNWSDNIKWPDGQTPDLTDCQTALLRFVSGDGQTWYGQLCGLNYQ